MDVGRVVLAMVLGVVGVVFTGQGLGYIGGSFMTSDLRWTFVGIALVAAAIALIWSARRR